MKVLHQSIKGVLESSIADNFCQWYSTASKYTNNKVNTVCADDIALWAYGRAYIVPQSKI